MFFYFLLPKKAFKGAKVSPFGALRSFSSLSETDSVNNFSIIFFFLTYDEINEPMIFRAVF